jgi:tetratricopeptide (TPR) repeat protein
MEFDMNDPPAWYREMERSHDLAVAALAAGKKEEAISLLDRVLAIQSTHKSAALLKSRALRELGRPAEGLHDLEAAIDRRPLDESLLEELAAVRLALGEPAKALDAVARALTQDGAVPGARYTGAVALAELGDLDGALDALEDALRHGFVDLAALEKETRFEPIAEDPRFREVVAAMEDFRRAVEAAKR